MKTRKSMKCLPKFRSAFSNIFMIAFWASILFRIIANSVDDGAKYQAAEAFEPSATEQVLLMDTDLRKPDFHKIFKKQKNFLHHQTQRLLGWSLI